MQFPNILTMLKHAPPLFLSQTWIWQQKPSVTHAKLRTHTKGKIPAPTWFRWYPRWQTCESPGGIFSAFHRKIRIWLLNCVMCDVFFFTRNFLWNLTPNGDSWNGFSDKLEREWRTQQVLIYLKTFTFFICFWLFFAFFCSNFGLASSGFVASSEVFFLFFCLVFKYSILSGNQTLHRLDHRLNSDSESGFANLQSVLSPICVQSGFFGGGLQLCFFLYRFFFR